jgi:hypothetical protein
MSLYGVVTDQMGDPVPNAHVVFDGVAQARFQVPILAGEGKERTWRIEATSGPDGKFAIHDGWGTTLHLESIERSGYERACPYETFHFGRSRPGPPYRPDPGKPAVFMCWNNAIKRVISRDITAQLGLDWYALGYRSGRFSKYGTGDENIEVRIIRPVGNQPPPYDWTLEIEGINGKVTDANGPLKPEAPDGQYTWTLRYPVHATDPAWSSKMTVHLYSKGTDTLAMSRLYAGVELSVALGATGQNPTVAVHYTANFGNSRDLTPQPVKPAAR